MRLTRHIIVFLCIVQSCKKEEKASIDQREVVMSYIESNFKRSGMDIRLFEPPPPPEWKDSIGHSGRVRPDSVTQKLAPFFIYLDPVITDNSDDNIIVKIPKGFEFIRNVKKSGKELRLDTDKLSTKKGLNIIVKTSDEFYKIFDSIKFKEGYGGLYGFGNVIYSEDGQKAYFEMYYFRRSLNGGTSVIFATKKEDGTWEYQTMMINIS